MPSPKEPCRMCFSQFCTKDPSTRHPRSDSSTCMVYYIYSVQTVCYIPTPSPVPKPADHRKPSTFLRTVWFIFIFLIGTKKWTGSVVILTHSLQKRMNKLSVEFSSWSFNAFTVCITQTCPHTVTAYTEALDWPSASTSNKLMESCFKNAKQKTFVLQTKPYL